MVYKKKTLRLKKKDYENTKIIIKKSKKNTTKTL